VTPRVGDISVLAVFAVSRLVYFLAGFRFNATPVSGFMQMIDPALMRTDLLRSLWYLHMQPPGHNLFVGLAVKLFPDRYGDVLRALQIAMGAVIAVSLFRLICRLGVPVFWACVLSSIFVISPGCVLYENLASYEYPILLFLLLSALALARFCESLSISGTTEPVAAGSPPIPGLEGGHSGPVPPSTRWAVAFFGCLLALELIRNSFHIVYLLAVAAGLLWFLPAARRAILIGAVPAILVLAGIYVKNGLLFGRFVSSTFGGMLTGNTTSLQLSKEEADDLVARGLVTPLVKIKPFSPLRDYEPYIHRPPKTGIPVLDQDTTSTGHPNYNNLAYLQLHDQYLTNAIAIWRHYPIAYLRSILIAWFSYCLPASDSQYFGGAAPAPIQAWERGFSTVVFGQVRRMDPYKNFLDLTRAGHNLSWVLYVGIFLLILIPATVIWGLAQLVSPRRRRLWTRTQLMLLGFMLFTIVYLTLVSNLISSFDGNRYRFPLDGFFVAIFGGMLVQAREWYSLVLRRRPAKDIKIKSRVASFKTLSVLRPGNLIRRAGFFMPKSACSWAATRQTGCERRNSNPRAMTPPYAGRALTGDRPFI
jgi:hypothetical protein